MAPVPVPRTASDAEPVEFLTENPDGSFPLAMYERNH